MLLVEQNASRTLEIADRCYVLRNGKVAAHAHRGELKTDQLAHLYLGVEEIV